jgi:hypothetical protein
MRDLWESLFAEDLKFLGLALVVKMQAQHYQVIGVHSNPSLKHRQQICVHMKLQLTVRVLR